LKLILSCVVVAGIAGAASAQFHQINLVSDGAVPAQFTDPNLKNPWGLAYNPFDPNAAFWIANNGTGVLTDYGVDGYPLPQYTVHAPGKGQQLTGVVWNMSNSFMVSNDKGSAPARLIMVSEDGMMSAYSPKLDSTHAVRVWNNVVPNSYYTGITIGKSYYSSYLYAANFGRGQVDQFDTNFNLVKSFSDSTIPDGYAPFNVKALGAYLVVTYAKRDGVTGEVVPGDGYGYVDIFSTDGTFIKRLVTNSHLNAPWGIALAPDQWTNLAGRLIIGNFGDGLMNTYDRANGTYMSTLTKVNGNPVQITGLWSVEIRDVQTPGSTEGDRHTRPVLFFTAGSAGNANVESHGLFGELTWQGTASP